MTDTATTGANIKFKAILGSATLLLLVIIWLVYDWVSHAGSPCDRIFQQTSAQFDLSLKHLDTEGQLILGRQQIQELTEQAQLTALNLKACCLVHDTGAIDSDGFMQCRDGSDTFATRLASLEQSVEQMKMAVQTDNRALQQQIKQQVDVTLEESKVSASALQTTLDGLQREPLNKQADHFFFDDFDQSQLGTDWEIRQPDDRRWALQSDTSSLLIVTQKGSIGGNRTDLRNHFVLNHSMPDDDFVLETQVSIAIQNQKNGVSMGVWMDDDNFLQIGYFGFPSGYNVRRKPYFLKEVDGRANYQDIDIGRTGGTTQPETLYLRIVRQGNKFTGLFALAPPRTKPNKRCNGARSPPTRYPTFPVALHCGQTILTAACIPRVIQSHRKCR